MSAGSKSIRAVASVAALVALAGCSGGDPGSPSGPESSPGQGTPVPSAAPSSSAPKTSPSGSTTSPTSTTADNDALLEAAATALAKVSGGTLISIETEKDDTQWEVQIVTSDGVEHEVELNADGTEVLSGPTKKSEDAEDREKHRERVAAAELDYKAAVKAIVDAVPGRVTELNLDTEKGVTVWEADVIDADSVKHEVSIDAASGEIVEQN